MATGSRITALQVRNFKSIGMTPQTLQIRPLTVLAGANSSGKSTLMQPLLLLKQTLESEFDPGPLRLDGSNVRLSEAGQIISQVPGANKFRCEFGFRLWTGDWYEIELGLTRASGLSLVANTWRHRDGLPERRIEPRYGNSREHTFRCFVGLSSRPPSEPDPPQFAALQLMEAALLVVHVHGVRGRPERNYRSTGVVQRFIGLFDAYTASMIQQWQSDPRDGPIQILQQWLGMLGLTDRLEARKLNDVTLEIRIGRLQQSGNPKRNGMVSIADVGFGVSQALPVLVAMLAAPRTGLVYIEQPELHLHPNPQVKLAHIFAQMANAGGASIVVETHSSLLIREIQTLVAEGKLDPSIVSLNWCSRDPKTGATTVTEAAFDADGTYGDWPIDFDDVALDSERRFLDATLVRKKR